MEKGTWLTMIVPSSDFHIHSTFCDGSATPEQVVQAAIKKGLKAIGFSSHAAWPMTTGCEMHPDRFGEYKDEINRLRKLYEGQLDIFLGLETDYLPPLTTPESSFYKEFGLDYQIGSVHYICNPDKPQLGMFAIDDRTEVVAAGIRNVYAGDTRRVTQEYFSTVRDMISTCSFDIIGHIDLIRKRNGELKLFREDESWYINEMKATAEVAAKSGKIVEINTGGMARGAIDTTYPSPRFLEMLHDLDVPVVFDSDTHNPDHLGFRFDMAAATAVQAGYTEARTLTRDGWITISLI